MCRAIGSRIRGTVAGTTFDHFHRNSADIIRRAIFGVDAEGNPKTTVRFIGDNLVINNVEGVSESIVVERNGRLVALVQPVENFIEWDKESEDKLYEKLDAWKAKLLKATNKSVSKASQVSSIEVMKEPFEKTATQKIRRFKYKDTAPTVEEESKKEN